MMIDPNPKTTQDSESGRVSSGGNTQETSQAEGGETPDQTERKVGHTPGQAEGTENPAEQDEK